MTWEIIENEQSDKECIDTVENFIASFVGKIHNTEITNLALAWERVEELAQKGIVAEKYTEQWDNERRTK